MPLQNIVHWEGWKRRGESDRFHPLLLVSIKLSPPFKGFRHHQPLFVPPNDSVLVVIISPQQVQLKDSGGGGSRLDCGNARFLHSRKGMASSSVISPEDVLESLMNDGTIDALRLKIINQLKANEELKSTTIKMAEQSKVLNTPGAEKQTKRELFDALRLELEAPVLEKASKSVWDLILDNNGLGREISETVERVFCRLSGQEPPLFPPLSAEVAQTDNKETDNRKDQKGKGKERENENVNSNTTKKRSFSEINSQGVNETATRSSDSAAAPEGPSKSPLPNSKS